MIFRGTGLNFGNDPFATVGEGGDTDGGKEEAAEEEGLERGYRMKGRKQEGEEKRGDQVDTDGGRKGEGPLIGGHYLNHVKRQNCIYLFK